MISQDEKNAIAKYGLTEIDEEKLFTFSVVLCDNEIDRDGERFSTEALYGLADLFLGKSGIFDHEAKASAQSARIYSTEVEVDENRITAAGELYHRLKAKAYMVKHKGNEDLIAEIAAGIKKEVSVGCRMDRKTCSVCGEDVTATPCSHEKSAEVHHILENPIDAYEWSFVVVPAQKSAGVTKSFGGSQMGEDSGISPLELEILKKQADFGKEYQENLIRDFMVVALKACPEISGKTIRKIGEKLSPEELKTLKQTLSVEKPKSQLLPAENNESTHSYQLS